jgi:hypothetical protein
MTVMGLRCLFPDISHSLLLPLCNSILHF